MPTTKKGKLDLETYAGIVRVHVPGYEITLTPSKQTPKKGIETKSLKAKVSRELHPSLDHLCAILGKNGLMEHIELSLDGIRPTGDGKTIYTMKRPGSSAPHFEIEAPVPVGHLVIAMVSTGGIIQWYLPINTPEAIHPSQSKGLEAKGAQPANARFIIPVHSVRIGMKEKGAKALDFSSVIGSVIKFFKFKIVYELIDATVTKIMQYVADYVEGKLKQEGLKLFDPGRNYPVLPDVNVLKGKRSLLLVHGIFSSTSGCFEVLSKQPNLMAYLRGIYGDNIIGYDHWTIAKTPFENAADLLRALPDDGKLDIDIVCHSRGGLVTRSILEHPKLADSCNSKIETVRSAIFVASANQGSPLASYNSYTNIFNIFSALGSLPGVAASGSVSIDLIVGVLKVIAHSAFQIPSVKALAPDTPGEPNVFIQQLNGPSVHQVNQYCVAHANFDPVKFNLLAILDPIIDYVFKGKANDLVVPFDGAAIFDRWIQCRIDLPFGSESESQGVVYHTNFFSRTEVHGLLREWLEV